MSIQADLQAWTRSRERARFQRCHPFADDIRWFLDHRRSPPHAHSCPECYQPFPCGDDCGIIHDLTLDNGILCGNHHVCPPCAKNPQPCDAAEQ